MESGWLVGILFVIAVGAIAVAWWGIAIRITKTRTRQGLARVDVAPSDDQLLGLVTHRASDDHVRHATGEISADELRDTVDHMRAAAGDDAGGAEGPSGGAKGPTGPTNS